MSTASKSGISEEKPGEPDSVFTRRLLRDCKVADIETSARQLLASDMVIAIIQAECDNPNLRALLADKEGKKLHEIAKIVEDEDIKFQGDFTYLPAQYRKQGQGRNAPRKVPSTQGQGQQTQQPPKPASSAPPPPKKTQSNNQRPQSMPPTISKCR